MPPGIHARNYVRAALELFDGYGDADAISGGGRVLSYRDVAELVLRLAAELQHHGARPGSSVLIFAGNTVELPALQLAVHLIGARAMWIAPVTGRIEIAQFARMAEPDLYVYDPVGKAGPGGALAEDLGVPVLCLGPGGAGPDILDRSPREFVPPQEYVEPATCLQTSGTTGVPKLVHHRQSFYEQVMRLAAGYVAEGLPRLRHLSHSPIAFASGHMPCLFNLFTGGVLFLEETFEAGNALAIIGREQINSAFVSPPLLYQLLDHPALAGTDTSAMFMLNVGAGPAAPSRLRQAIERFGPCLRIVYGLSEVIVVTAQPGLTDDPAHPERLRSAGLPYGDVRVEIRDPDRNPLPIGQTGEIWVSSRLNFAGYWGNPELTTDTIFDGWVRTRDLGFVDADGYLFIVDRTTDMIIGKSGWSIYTRPIEDVLIAQDGVSTAAVIGVPDEVFGEVPWAYVVPYDPADPPSAEQLCRTVETVYDDIWRPRGVDFVDELPLTVAGKVDKQALRARHPGAR